MVRPMPRHNPDVIAALAEGRLDPEEAAALEREISADPVAAAELAAHRIALAAIADASKPSMSMAERSDLRDAVADALGITAAEPAAEETSARRVPWASLGIAAATLAGLMAIVPIAGLLSTGGADDAASLELGALAPTSTAAEEAAADAEMRAAPAADELAVVSDGDLDDALMAGETGNDAVGFGSSTTVARTTTAAAAPATTTPATTTTAPAPESSTTSSTASEAVQQLTAELEVIRSDPTAVTESADEALAEDACYVEDAEKILVEPRPSRFRFEYENGQLTVIVYFELVGTELGPFQVWGLPDCADLVVIP